MAAIRPALTDDGAALRFSVDGAADLVIELAADGGWGGHPGQCGFGGAHTLLITTPASLDELNARILETGGEHLPMNRFRPNLVVPGWSEPHTGDKVLKATIGSIEVGYSSRSIRCAVPTIDQTTGTRSAARRFTPVRRTVQCAADRPTEAPAAWSPRTRRVRLEASTYRPG